MTEQNEIAIYQPNENVQLQVRLMDDTVWLNRHQMAQLFGRDIKTIGKHIANALNEELSVIANFAPTQNRADLVATSSNSVVAKIATTASDGKTYQVEYYNLDVILSVGYRVKSGNGIAFRRWANSVLKNYLLRGYAINQRLLHIESELAEHRSLLQKHDNQLEFYVRTTLPPAEQVFFEGDFFEARVALEALVKTAKQRVIIIDGYVDALTFDILDVRSQGVKADIYTAGVGEGMHRLMAKHDEQKDKEHIEVHKWRNTSHDRWLIIDDILYHCGHSLNALGNHLSAITKMGISPETILKQLT